MKEVLSNLVTGLALLLLALFAYMVFVVGPVILYAERECLKAGYPKASVTITLDRYCLTLEGATNAKAVKLP